MRAEGKAPTLTVKQKVSKLERILESHTARERRTLADIRNLGFEFRTVAQAQAYAKAQATLERMTRDELIALIQQAPSPRREPQEQKPQFTDAQLAAATRAAENRRAS